MRSPSHIAYARYGEQSWSRAGKQPWSPLRIVFFVMAMVAALLVVPGASTVARAAPPVSRDHVVGTGTLGSAFGSPTLHVNAVNTGNGVNGNFTITYPDGTFVSGTVTCFVVAGNEAVVIGQITESSGPREGIFPEGTFTRIDIQDNGEPGTAGPDMLNFSPGTPSPTTPVCPAPTLLGLLPIVAGNFQVFDR